ncbi:MAG: CopG family transcriptional regulator [Candidatus Brocadia sp. AMX3]|nr:CopG family transcriptional regulator [Candidatus Brocadia sp. AMX3]
MDRKSVTLLLPKSLLKKAEAIAASEEKSLSELMKESLEKKVLEATGYGKARERQLNLLKRGFDLGTKGSIALSRKELHARR